MTVAKGSTNRPIRVLQVVGGMAQGGIETWLMHCLRHIDCDRISMDFLVHTDQPCAYDDEIRALGSQIIPCLTAHQPWRYGLDLLTRLQEFGPYDIVHSHLHHFTGIPLQVARLARIPVRIAHSHNDLSSDAAQQWYRRFYFSLMKHWIRQAATQGLACSQRAAAALYGPHWPQDGRWQVLYYGLDLQPFQETVDCAAARAEFDLPADAYVIGHVGRFVPQKNHRFLLEIMAEMCVRSQDVYLLLVGDGPLKPQIQAQVEQLGIQARVRWAGLRQDVPQLMGSVMDHFLFPSNFEGLGLVLVEAQAAGLPCLLSSVVPPEVTVVPELLQRLNLTEAASVWADQLQVQRQTTVRSAHNACAQITASPFNIQTAVRRLAEIYIEAMPVAQL